MGCSLALGGCASSGGRGANGLVLLPQTTVAERCSVAADANSPLVTEWSAAEKAHLEGLLRKQVVAVEYSGCELRIVQECRLPGEYVWHQTTLATDTISIDSEDELYAKLPIGAESLQTALKRSGHLAVQTTVSGQMRVRDSAVSVPRDRTCANATHWISALSIGAFKLFSGESTSGGTGLNGELANAHASSSNQLSVLREAGERAACVAATEETSDPNCASPIQLFLEPMGRQEQYARQAQARRSGAVLLSFPSPEAADEHWTLRNGQGRVLCTIPCRHWVPPVSQFYLQREETEPEQGQKVLLPESFAVRPGTTLEARYRAERGAPLTSTIIFWGLGGPLILTGALFVAVDVSTYFQDRCDADCKEDRVVLPISAAAYFAMAAGLYYWYSWSHEAALELEPRAPVESKVGIRLGPGWLEGTF